MCHHPVLYRHVCPARLDTLSKKPDLLDSLTYLIIWERNGEEVLAWSSRALMEREGEETNGILHDGVTEPTVFRGTEYSPVQTIFALALWLGAIHLTAFLILTAIFFFPSSLSFSSVSSTSVCFFFFLRFFPTFSIPTFFGSFPPLFREDLFDESWPFFVIFQNLWGAAVLHGSSSQWQEQMGTEIGKVLDCVSIWLYLLASFFFFF